MKSARLALLAAAAASVASAQSAAPAPAAAASTPPSTPPPVVASSPAAPASLQDAITKGKVSVNLRLRYESVDQEALTDAEALTLRLRLGYMTGVYNGFQAFVEGEHITAADDNYFDGTGANPDGYATIADPELSQINQAWVSYAYEQSKLTVGRQRIVLDNARFVGDVGWRQNQQTFDAAFVQDKTLKNTTLTYGYVSEVNRIFDNSAGPTAATTQYDYNSDSHLINASYSGLKVGTLTAYGYLLDFDNAPNNSTSTVGLSFAGATKLSDGLSLLYRAEYATQSDYGSSTLDYTSDYYVGEIGAKFLKNYSLTGGYEVLGSDDGLAGSGFKTPLATLHAFNGWADKFLNTPDAGLTDAYVKFAATLPYDLSFLGFYHHFGTQEGASDVGQEIDLQLTYKVNKNLSVAAKTALYTAEDNVPVVGGSNLDTDKYWIEATYAF